MLETKYSKTKVYDEPLYKEPTCPEQVFSIKNIDVSGVFGLNNNKYSKCFILSDINFDGLTDGEQKDVILSFSKVLNGLSCRYSYTVANEYVDDKEFNNRVLYRDTSDNGRFGALCDAFNEIITEKVTDSKQGLYETIYLTITVTAKNLFDARNQLDNIEGILRSSLMQIGVNGISGSTIMPMDINERMQKIYNFSHSGFMTNYKFDFYDCLALLRDWVDIVSPETIDFYNTYFVMNGNRWGKVLHISRHAANLDSSMISKILKDKNCTMYVTINAEPIDLEAFNQELQRKYGKNGMQINSQRNRNRRNNDFLSDASESLLREKDKLDELDAIVQEGEDKYFNVTFLVMYLATSEQEMNEIHESLLSTAGGEGYEITECFGMQREALNSSLTFGVQEFKRCANFSSLCLGMYIPFKTQELNMENGSFYGVNQLSQNPIFGDRKKLDSGYHAMFLGGTRSGKSVFTKLDIASTRIKYPTDQIIVIDPMNEYKTIAKFPGIDGSIISFDTKKKIYVNPMDVNFENVDYSSLTEIISEKTDFIISLLAVCMKHELDTEQKGILGDVIEKIYSENYAMRMKLNGLNTNVTEFSVPNYMRTQTIELPNIVSMSAEEQERAYSPLLQDIYQRLLDNRDNIVAQKLAAHMQIFVNGSLSLFNHRTNVDLSKDTLVFDLDDISKNLKVTCMLIMLEIIRNKIKQNCEKGNWTRVYIDEFHELLSIPAVTDYVIKLWKEVGKLNGCMTGITQNMTDLLNNNPDSARLAAIVSNTDFFALLKQSAIDMDILGQFLRDISPAMFSYVAGAPRGTGLLKMGPTTIPFDIRMNKNCKLYQYINTDGYNNTEEEAELLDNFVC